MATITITQSFNANGGTFGTSTAWADQTQTVEEGSSATFTIPANGPTRSGYIFIGWSSNSWATTPYINVSTSVQTVVLTKNRIWYAVWTKRPVYIKIDSNIVKAYPYIKLNDEIRECYFYKNGMN